MEATQDIPKSQEDIIFEEMSNGLSNIRSTREALIDQLSQVVKTTHIDIEADAPRKSEMKLALFKTVDDLLKSQESTFTTKTKLSLMKKSEASNESVKQMAIEILRNINMKQKANAPVAVTEADTQAMKAAYAQMNAEDPSTEIKDDELVMEETATA